MTFLSQPNHSKRPFARESIFEALVWQFVIKAEALFKDLLLPSYHTSVKSGDLDVKMAHHVVDCSSGKLGLMSLGGHAGKPKPQPSLKHTLVIFRKLVPRFGLPSISGAALVRRSQGWDPRGAMVDARMMDARKPDGWGGGRG